MPRLNSPGRRAVANRAGGEEHADPRHQLLVGGPCADHVGDRADIALEEGHERLSLRRAPALRVHHRPIGQKRAFERQQIDSARGDEAAHMLLRGGADAEIVGTLDCAPGPMEARRALLDSPAIGREPGILPVSPLGDKSIERAALLRGQARQGTIDLRRIGGVRGRRKKSQRRRRHGRDDHPHSIAIPPLT